MSHAHVAPLLAALATAALLGGMPAKAADLTAAPDVAPEAQADVAAAFSPWQVRLRALGVLPTDSGDVDGIAGSDLSYTDSVIPELDISYYFTKNISAELILGTTHSSIHGDGSVKGLGKVGKTWILPPTLTAQYHFTNFGAFQPYLGAGVNYTIFYNQDSAGAMTDIKVKNAFGVALQAGFDYMIDEHWGVNADVKKIFLRPDWEGVAGGAAVKGTAKLDPWLIGGGVTYRF
ncbi:OmpW/AlkL family protein [Rhizobium sp. G21]|uniref:OmpW/AlkL family protein n=1 Tax=Rhizobium sp. G21 TaxID=2758439 RepID=UPI001601E3C2|nr:OmpW family protein [Rhizobium sp. G21]MBB1248361.1 OmpW family protein [Rhizobium sp. G21]